MFGDYQADLHSPISPSKILIAIASVVEVQQFDQFSRVIESRFHILF
jgi:hypothetical protein